MRYIGCRSSVWRGFAYFLNSYDSAQFNGNRTGSGRQGIGYVQYRSSVLRECADFPAHIKLTWFRVVRDSNQKLCECRCSLRWIFEVQQSIMEHATRFTSALSILGVVRGVRADRITSTESGGYGSTLQRLKWSPTLSYAVVPILSLIHI